MITQHTYNTLVILLLSLLVKKSFGVSLPITYSIPKSSVECMLEELHEDEYATFSVLATDGLELVARVTIEGPIAPSEDRMTTSQIDSYWTAYQRGSRYTSGKPEWQTRGVGFDRKGNYYFNEFVDFENVMDHMIDDYDYIDDYIDDDDDDDGEKTTPEERKRRQELREQRMRRMESRGRMQGDPWTKTVKIKAPGWYCACVNTRRYEVDVQLDFRKSSEYGYNEEKGYVHTYEEFERLKFDHQIDEDAAKEEDLKIAREKLKNLNKVVFKMREMQREESRRLDVHSAINEHSHSRMVLGSLFETVVFICISLFQVFTIRRWFKDPILGM